jgi:DNA-binding SARP family transcriptional activator
VEFRILGQLEIVDQGRALPLGGARQRTLLALLLLRANEVVSADRLIDGLWGARPPQGAANALQYHVSQLRKTLAPYEAIITQEPGYVIRVGPAEFDLLLFERLVREAHDAAPERAAQALREALRLWRGPPLADLATGSFAQVEIARLEELRLEALERRLDADLALGRHAGLVGEVQSLVRDHPLRERLRGVLMQALYGAGRQAEALEVYRETRRLLVNELGIEPSPALRELEQAILRHDPALAPRNMLEVPRPRAIMVAASDPSRLDDLLAIAVPLARRSARELILARFLHDHGALAVASSELATLRDTLAREGVGSRVATHTTDAPGQDAVRLATEQDVDLILLDAAPGLLQSGLPDSDLAAVLERAPCDVGVLVGGDMGVGPVVTPFGGVEHDWAAIEVAAWLAQALGTTLRLLGTEANPAIERRDASRLLSRASLLVQQVVGIVTEPVLVRTGEAGVLEASRDAGLLVVGLSDRWRTEGIGQSRLAVAVGAEVPTLFVRRGLRSGAVAPSETMTRFGWTLAGEGSPPGDVPA